MIVGLGIGVPFNTKTRRIIAKDSFNRANNTASLGNDETGRIWTAHTGTWGINGNQAYVSAGSGDSHATIDSGIKSFLVEVTLATIDTESGLVFRYADENNWFRFVVSGGAFYLQKKIAGALTTLSSFTQTPGNGDILKIIVNKNDTIQAFRNNVLKATITDNGLNNNTRVGMEINGVACSLDNFKVEEN